MPALVPAVVDVPLGVLNQTPSDTQGVLGRLKELINAQVHHYEGQAVNGSGATIPAKLKVEPRDPFISLPSTARSVTDGTSVSLSWSLPEILNSLENQLISICGGVPRVFNGSTWSGYTGTTVLPYTLSEDVFHTSQHTIQAPDSAWLSGVTCSVWTETLSTSTGPLTTSYLGFRSDTGAWLVTPTALYASVSPSVVASAKTVSDGSHFYVFYNDASVVNVGVYDTHGALLGTNSIGLHSGIWDVTPAVTASPNAGTVLFAQSLSLGSNSGVFLTSLGFSAPSTVTAHSALDASIQCAGPLAFITNKTGNGLSYLATGKSVSTNYRIFAYEIQNLGQVHEFDSANAFPVHALDTITGFVTSGGGGATVTLSIGVLPTISAPASHGPVVDPQLRYITTLSVDRSNTVAHLRTTQSVCQVSRAFEIDGQYYVYAYYQSGGGLALTPQSQNVTITNGDYMVGAASQPITLSPGDHTFGSPINTSSISIGGNTVFVTAALTTRNIASGDSVKQVAMPSGFQNIGIPAGTPVLLWTFANLSAGTADFCGGQLVVSSSSVSLANSTWDVIALSNTSTTQFYTALTDINGTTGPTAATFSNTGTFVVNSFVAYQTGDLSSLITSDVSFFYTSGGTITVSGADPGTFNISRLYLGQGFTYGLATPSSVGQPYSVVWVPKASQTTTNSAFTAVVTPQNVNRWAIKTGTFDSTYIGADLVVTADPAVAPNVGTYPITAVPSSTILTTGNATAILPQIFSIPYPTIEIELTTQNAYTFLFQSLTLDYTYQGALVSIQGADNPNNNGVYTIVQINADGTFIATPNNGLQNQTNEAFTNAQTVTIIFDTNIDPQFQPTWLMVPLTGSQPVTGRFEYGLAYADWRIESDTTFGPNQYPMCVSSVVATSSGAQLVLPYRAQSVTVGVPFVSSIGQIAATQELSESTVGLKSFTLSNSLGQSYTNSGELLIPGPMATTFTASGFHEDGINLALEAPFLVSQSVAGDTRQLALTTGATYSYIAVAEYTDENGNRIFSIPSPALEVQMSGSNNVATLGGRLLFPLSSTGQPVANTYGPTTRLVTLSIYRTAFINGEPTTEHYKVTNDLDVNGLAPISTLNPSGFSFPNSFTWQYLDQNPDAGLTNNEILYTDKSLLPRYPAPAFSTGLGSWKNREWVIGYDDAVWMSGEKAEGDAIWFHPVLRFVLPTEDKPKALGSLEDYLLVFCSNSIWYIPAATFPDATGSNGTLPTPVQLPFQNGSANGFAATIREGAVYDSTAGGLWLITRNLENIWLSHPVQDSLTQAITGLALDSNQRLFVQQAGSNTVCVYDGIPKTWYLWNTPTQGRLITSYQGQAAYQDTSTVNLVTPGQSADIVGGTTYAIAPDITLAPFSFANVRGLKRVWEFQLVGQYLGPHNLNVVLSYPEDDQPTTIYQPFTALPAEPYIYPFNPLLEEASQFGIRVFADFNGIATPGQSFALEMVSAQVGVDPAGINSRPAFVRLTART